MKVLPGTTGISIANQLTKITNDSLIKREITRFPDDELYIRIKEDITDENILIIQTTYPDENIIELFLLTHAAREAGAQQIILAIPYYGYSRQDKQFTPGEPISAKTLAQHLSLHADGIITIDPHKNHILNFFTIPAYQESVIPEIVEYLKLKKTTLLLAPDIGALERTQHAAKLINCDCDYLEKTRIDGKTIKIQPKILDVKGKNVAIIDDIISTGGTMATAIRELKKQGAAKVYATCAHGLFIADSIQKIQAAGCDMIIASDTIPNQFNVISSAPSILRALNHFK